MPSNNLRLLDAHAVKAMLSDRKELALIDLREELIFSRSHLLWARSIPLSRLELRFARLFVIALELPLVPAVPRLG